MLYNVKNKHEDQFFMLGFNLRQEFNKQIDGVTITPHSGQIIKHQNCTLLVDFKHFFQAIKNAHTEMTVLWVYDIYEIFIDGEY